MSVFLSRFAQHAKWECQTVVGRCRSSYRRRPRARRLRDQYLALTKRRNMRRATEPCRCCLLIPAAVSNQTRHGRSYLPKAENKCVICADWIFTTLSPSSSVRCAAGDIQHCLLRSLVVLPDQALTSPTALAVSKAVSSTPPLPPSRLHTAGGREGQCVPSRYPASPPVGVCFPGVAHVPTCGP